MVSAKRYYYFYDESEGTFHRWQEKTVIRKANQFKEATEEGDIEKITDIDEAIDYLSMLNIVEGRKEEYM